MAWTCILQTFINEMRLDNTDEEKVVDLIISVHNYLGNKGWCWDFNGEFLSLALDFLIYQVNIKREKLILKCLGCFYKQLRCNFLTAHKGTGVNLHWDNIHFIYDHFTPKKLPSFDESSDPIDSKTEELFRSLLSMIPDNLNPEKYSQFISEYIDNGKPIEASSNIPKDRVTQNIYYYLADYYLKHQDFKKAIKFYILDLTLNLDRFDSWVGCALSLADEIEQYSSPAKLSSFLLIY
ncbi:calcineurin-binding protein cabin-1-like [Panonychus citri]|uniref:calcineurin-binding protein cabin-1-like n=1 Tax=Panonychus citri TaxID=50023 RepID=UPI0023075C58|nr:calcineurin-binding protein cabin-1-like [Panonychus citri]